MKQLTSLLKQFLLLAGLVLGAIVVTHAQQPDPLTITKDGKVGIGTSSPANKLSVSGGADVSGNVGIGTTTPANKLSVTGNADVSGNVGIGTTKPVNKLSVQGVADVSEGLGVGTNNLGTSKFKIADPSGDFAHFRFAGVGGGELEFVRWTNGWNINSKSNGKHLYLNRDAQTNSDVLIGRDGKEMIVKGDTGNIGIGTSAPGLAKLQIAGGATPALRLDANSGVAALSIGGTGGLFVDAPGTTGGRLIVKDDGTVGIGTNNPTKAKLEINGAVGYRVGTFGFLNKGGNTGTYNPNGSVNYSIWATNNIAAAEFHSFSDARIKNIQGRSDSANDLRTLLNIEVTDYRYKDAMGRGNGAYKKVTGQQVEKVFPQAVSKQTEVVPDIYQQASIQDGWISLATDLKKGDRVKLITATGEEGVYEVLEASRGRFRVDFKPTANRLFVYGREVNDFLSVDYGAISMLNVSATQQIKKEKDEEVKALQEENAALRNQLAEQEKRLAAIEALLLAGDKHPERAAALKKVE